MFVASLTMFDSESSLSLFLPVQGLERTGNPRDGSPSAHPCHWGRGIVRTLPVGTQD